MSAAGHDTQCGRSPAYRVVWLQAIASGLGPHHRSMVPHPWEETAGGDLDPTAV